MSLEQVKKDIQAIRTKIPISKVLPDNQKVTFEENIGEEDRFSSHYPVADELLVLKNVELTFQNLNLRSEYDENKSYSLLIILQKVFCQVILDSANEPNSNEDRDNNIKQLNEEYKEFLQYIYSLADANNEDELTKCLADLATKFSNTKSLEKSEYVSKALNLIREIGVNPKKYLHQNICNYIAYKVNPKSLKNSWWLLDFEHSELVESFLEHIKNFKHEDTKKELEALSQIWCDKTENLPLSEQRLKTQVEKIYNTIKNLNITSISAVDLLNFHRDVFRLEQAGFELGWKAQHAEIGIAVGSKIKNAVRSLLESFTKKTDTFEEKRFLPDKLDEQQIYLLVEAVFEVYKSHGNINAGEKAYNFLSTLKACVEDLDKFNSLDSITNAIYDQYDAFLKDPEFKINKIKAFRERIAIFAEKFALNLDDKNWKNGDLRLENKEIQQAIHYITQHSRKANVRNNIFADTNTYVARLYPLLEIAKRCSPKVSFDDFVDNLMKDNAEAKKLLTAELGNIYTTLLDSGTLRDVESFRHYLYQARKDLKLDLSEILKGSELFERKKFEEFRSRATKPVDVGFFGFTLYKKYHYKAPLKAILKMINILEGTSLDYDAFINEFKDKSKTDFIAYFATKYNDMIRAGHEISKIEAYRTAVLSLINYRSSKLGRYSVGINETEVLKEFKDTDTQIQKTKALNLVNNSIDYLNRYPKISAFGFRCTQFINLGPVKAIASILAFPFKMTGIPKLLSLLNRKLGISSLFSSLFLPDSFSQSSSEINYQLNKVLNALDATQRKNLLPALSGKENISDIINALDKFDAELSQPKDFRLSVHEFIKTVSNSQLDIHSIVRDDPNNSTIVDKTAYQATVQTLQTYYNLTTKTGTTFVFGFTSFKKGNKEISDFINLMHLIGLNEEAEGLVNKFLQLEITKEFNEKQWLEQFLETSYHIVEGLILGKAPVTVDDGIIKKFKKSLSRFAEQNGFQKKLINRDKYFRAGITFEDENGQNFNSKYAYNPKFNNIVTSKKLGQRERKKSFKALSFKSSIWIATIEGVIAAAFGITLLAFLPFTWAIVIGVLIGLSGFGLNSFLYTTDAYETLKSLFIDGPSNFLKNIFLDENGREISTLKKVLVGVGAVACLGGGIIFGVYAFSSVMMFLQGIAFLTFLGAAIGFPPILIPLAIAAFAFTVNVIGNGSVFFTIMSDFIKNNRILQIVGFLKRSFIDVWKFSNEKGQAITLKEFAKLRWWQIPQHILSSALKFSVTLLITAGAVGFAALVIMLSFGLGYTKSIAALGYIPYLSQVITNSIGKVGTAIAAFAAPGNAFFYVRSIFRTFAKFNSVLVKAIDAITHPIRTATKDFPKSWNEFKNNPIRAAVVIIEIVLVILAIPLLLFNGVGYGWGAASAKVNVDRVGSTLAKGSILASILLNLNSVLNTVLVAVSLGWKKLKGANEVEMDPFATKDSLKEDAKGKAKEMEMTNEPEKNVLTNRTSSSSSISSIKSRLSLDSNTSASSISSDNITEVNDDAPEPEKAQIVNPKTTPKPEPDVYEGLRMWASFKGSFEGKNFRQRPDAKPEEVVQADSVTPVPEPS